MMRVNLILATALTCSIAGCSTKPAPPPYESTQATDSLRAALDAWRDGQLDSLTKRQPPLRFEDDDLRSGLILVTYELVPRDQPIQAYEDISVNVTLRDREGAAQEKTVVYQVTLEPSLAVLRND